MNNRPFVINEGVRAEIARVKAYAAENELTLVDLVQSITRGQAIGLDLGHYCEIPVGHRVVYSIEAQAIGRTHHVSVSVRDPDPQAVPALIVVNLICWMFGVGVRFMPQFPNTPEMRNFLQANEVAEAEPARLLAIYVEKFDGHDAFNVIAQMEADRDQEREDRHAEQRRAAEAAREDDGSDSLRRHLAG